MRGTPIFSTHVFYVGGDDARRIGARDLLSRRAPVEGSGFGMGCASSAQVRPREWDAPSPGLGPRPGSPVVESVESPTTSGRVDERLMRASPKARGMSRRLQVTTPPSSPGFNNKFAARLAFGGAEVDPGFPLRSPLLSPVAVTEGLFGTTAKKEPANPPKAEAAASKPNASGQPAGTSKPPKKLTAAQQTEADRLSLRTKLHEVDDLMFKATQKSIALATMEESLIRLQHAVSVERDGRVVAETQAEKERKLRERAEEKIQKEIDERHDLIARLDRANDVARHAENEARDLRLGAKFRDAEIDRSAQEKILEADLALCKRELAETLAKHAEERIVNDLEERMVEERPRLDEDSERTRVERKIKEAVQMALAKHEREHSVALMKASEDKVRALEVASVQRRQAMEVQDRLHQEELRRVQEAAARDAETIREEMRPTRWEIEKLQEDRVADQLKHAEERKLALEQANADYEANLEKIKLSHAYELATLRGANEDRLSVYERERSRNETKFSVLTNGLSVELADFKVKFERERELRRFAQDQSKNDLAAKNEAEKEFDVLRTQRREALDLVSEARRARDTAERRTKETYLEIERAKVAGDKRRFLHNDAEVEQRPSTAEREVDALPNALGLIFVDDLIATVATCRAEVHDLTAPKRAADLELEKYRATGGTDPSYVEAMSANAYKKTQQLERASEKLENALGALYERKNQEVKAIDDERKGLRRSLLGTYSDDEFLKSGKKNKNAKSHGNSDSDSETSDDGSDGKSEKEVHKNTLDSRKSENYAKPKPRGDTKTDEVKSPTEKEKVEKEKENKAVVETFTPPASPVTKVPKKQPYGQTGTPGVNVVSVNPQRPDVKPFKFTPLEW